MAEDLQEIYEFLGASRIDLSEGAEVRMPDDSARVVTTVCLSETDDAESLAAMTDMLEQVPGTGRATVRGDKGSDSAKLVREFANMYITPVGRPNSDLRTTKKGCLHTERQ